MASYYECRLTVNDDLTINVVIVMLINGKT